MIRPDNCKKICIATPAYGNSVTTQYLHSLALTVKAFTQLGVECNLITVDNDALIERARNQCVEEFRRMNADYLVFIDADIGWEASDLLILLASGKDCSGIPYPAKTKERKFVCNIINSNPFIICPETGFIKADHIGTGMMVLSKNMIDKMWEVHLREGKWYKDWNTKEPTAKLFEVALSQDNNIWSEDYTFCQKWTNIGGEIWVYPNAWIKHYGGKTWVDCMANGEINDEKKDDLC